LHAVVDGTPHSFVMAPVDETPALVGFEVRLDALAPAFRRAFERGPLLPPSLGGGTVTNAAVSLRVSDHAGRERFRSMDAAWPASQAVVPFGDAYEGVLAGSTVTVSLEPAAAD